MPFIAYICVHDGMLQSQHASINLGSKDLCITAGLVWDSRLVHWGTEHWQWFICQHAILTDESAREQVKNKRAEAKYLGLKLFWKFLIKKSITKQKKCCVVSRATYTGLQQGAKSFIFKAVITDKKKEESFFFPPLKNPRQIELLIWFYHFHEIPSIIGQIASW